MKTPEEYKLQKHQARVIELTEFARKYRMKPSALDCLSDIGFREAFDLDSSISVGEIFSGKRPMYVSRGVKRLSSLGYLDGRQGRPDKRVIRVNLTPQGKERYSELCNLFKEDNQ